MADPKRKAVRMWAVWWTCDAVPVEVHDRRFDARCRAAPRSGLQVVRVEIRPVEKKKRRTCGQCGKSFSARACGPTHASMAAAPKKRSKKRGR